MKIFNTLRVVLVASTIGLTGCAGMSAQDGWVPLIADGKGLENLVRVGDANWRVEGGLVVADRGKGGFLVTRD